MRPWRKLPSRGRPGDWLSAADFADPVPAATERHGRGRSKRSAASTCWSIARPFSVPDRWRRLSESEWDRHFAINLKAPCFLCREFAARHTPGDPGCIINIVDWRALRPRPGNLAYTLTKAALVTMTEILAQELAPEIRVNAVAPGAILPPRGSRRRISASVWRRKSRSAARAAWTT